MTMSRPQNPVVLAGGAVLVSIAALAPETSAQSRGAPPSLSAEIAEVLRSPFHVGATPAGAPDTRSPAPSPTLPITRWEAGPFATPLPRSGPDAQVPPHFMTIPGKSPLT